MGSFRASRLWLSAPLPVVGEVVGGGVSLVNVNDFLVVCPQQL